MKSMNRSGKVFEMDESRLVREAAAAREAAYAPYSGFSVGAALLTKSGKVYRGCNIENATYSPTNCAERTAFFKAVSEGERDFEAIAVVGGKSGEPFSDYCPPCGVCRQVMMEFCDPGRFRILLAKNAEEWKAFTLAEILPMGFGRDQLEKGRSE